MASFGYVMMTSLSLLWSTLYYVSLPLVAIFNWTLILLSPVIHLGHYAALACLFPLKIIAKFETLYIYLGVAAAIGLFTGCILHWSSSALASVFNLDTAPYAKGRSASIMLEDDENARRVRLDSGFMFKSRHSSWTAATSELPQKNATQNRKEKGLLEQTIIEEEDDDSDGGF